MTMVVTTEGGIIMNRQDKVRRLTSANDPMTNIDHNSNNTVMDRLGHWHPVVVMIHLGVEVIVPMMIKIENVFGDNRAYTIDGERYRGKGLKKRLCLPKKKGFWRV
jgi:hypothetical protein